MYSNSHHSGEKKNKGKFVLDKNIEKTERILDYVIYAFDGVTWRISFIFIWNANDESGAGSSRRK